MFLEICLVEISVVIIFGRILSERFSGGRFLFRHLFVEIRLQKMFGRHVSASILW